MAALILHDSSTPHSFGIKFLQKSSIINSSSSTLAIPVASISMSLGGTPLLDQENVVLPVQISDYFLFHTLINSPALIPLDNNQPIGIGFDDMQLHETISSVTKELIKLHK